MPLPLAVMIPFMAGQSFAMGEAFGKGFQYGKRRISAMTNEQFNAMSARDHFEETTADISEMIPSMKAQMNNFSTLQTDIIKTLIEQLKDAGITIAEAVGTTATDTFVEGPPGGTDLAQDTLDQLRNIVGLPPLYSKLVSPAGINALINFWKHSPKGLSPGNLAQFLIDTFNLRPATSSINWIISQMEPPTNNNLVGPPPPPGGVVPPDTQPDNTIVVNADGSITNKDVREAIGKAGTLRAPSSVITQFNKWNAQIRASETFIKSLRIGDERIKLHKGYIVIFNGNMLTYWKKYDLVGKVNTQYYSGPNQLVS